VHLDLVMSVTENGQYSYVCISSFPFVVCPMNKSVVFYWMRG